MRRWLQHLGFGATLLAGLWLASVVTGKPIPFAILVISSLLAVVLHELGHAFAGTLFGLRITAVAVGPYEFDCATSKIHPRLNHRTNATGAAVFAPSSASPDVAVKAWRWTILAGPLANLLLATILAWLSQTIFAGQPAAQEKLAYIALVNVVMGVVSLVPMDRGLDSSDGAVLWRLWTGGLAAANDMRAQQLGSLLASGARPKDWAPADLAIADYLLAEPHYDLHRTARVIAVACKYSFLADSGELRDAVSVLETAVPNRTLMRKRTSSDSIDLAIVMLAQHYALWGNDAARAHMLLDMLHPRSWVRSRIEFATTSALVKLGQDDREAAMAMVVQARNQLAPVRGRLGTVAMQSAWLDKVQQRINTQQKAPSPLFPVASQPAAEPVATPVEPAPRTAPVKLLPESRTPIPFPKGARTAWQDVTAAVSYAASLNPRQIVAEYGAYRSWLYHVPGVPLDHKQSVGNLAFAHAWAVSPQRLAASR